MEKNEIITIDGSSIVMYTSEDGTTQLDVKFQNETVWLSVEQMAMLFGRDRTVITRHPPVGYQSPEAIHDERLCRNQQRLDHYNELKDVVRLMSRAVTLMIAESKTEEKDVMVKVVVNLINKENK